MKYKNLPIELNAFLNLKEGKTEKKSILFQI